jgi:hypothetical protein
MLHLVTNTVEPARTYVPLTDEVMAALIAAPQRCTHCNELHAINELELDAHTLAWSCDACITKLNGGFGAVAIAN